MKESFQYLPQQWTHSGAVLLLAKWHNHGAATRFVKRLHPHFLSENFLYGEHDLALFCSATTSMFQVFWFKQRFRVIVIKPRLIACNQFRKMSVYLDGRDGDCLNVSPSSCELTYLKDVTVTKLGEDFTCTMESLMDIRLASTFQGRTRIRALHSTRSVLGKW